MGYLEQVAGTIFETKGEKITGLAPPNITMVNPV